MTLFLSKKFSTALVLSSVSIGIIQASASIALSIEIPKSLSVPKEEVLLLKSKAKGSQIYVCQSTSNPSSPTEPATYQWVFKAPKAALFDEQGVQQGKHYRGPTWEWQDGSKVQGKVTAKADSPEVRSIPWLLLAAQQPTATDVKTDAKPGVLSAVKWVQRLNTAGGKAPQTGCDLTHQNREVRISYTADYYFYGDRP
jgi:hypothetical protein